MQVQSDGCEGVLKLSAEIRAKRHFLDLRSLSVKWHACFWAMRSLVNWCCLHPDTGLKFSTLFRLGRTAGTETEISVLPSGATLERRVQCRIFSTSVMADYGFWETRTTLSTSACCTRCLTSLPNDLPWVNFKTCSYYIFWAPCLLGAETRIHSQESPEGPVLEVMRFFISNHPLVLTALQTLSLCWLIRVQVIIVEERTLPCP